MDLDRQQQQIRERAYQLWEQAGQPEGGAEEFWCQAERELEQEQSDQASDEALDMNVSIGKPLIGGS